MACLIILAVKPMTPSSIVSAAACSPPTEDYGTATISVNIPATGSYRVWSRMKSDPNASGNNSYLLEIDGNTCYVVGNTGVSNSSWTWVDFQNATTSNKINHNFSATGSHTVKMIGREANVSLDRVIFTQDTSCVPTGTGDNCADPPDTDPPAVNVTSPNSGSTVSGQVNIAATATDSDSGVKKVDLLVNGSVVKTDITSPYSYSWDTTSVANGNHSITARATDNSGNTATSSSVSVTVQNGTGGGGSTYFDEDINQDGTVNLLDFSLLASKFGQSGSSLGREDINRDGSVNILDFSLLASKFGQSSQ